MARWSFRGLTLQESQRGNESVRKLNLKYDRSIANPQVKNGRDPKALYMCIRGINNKFYWCFSTCESGGSAQVGQECEYSTVLVFFSINVHDLKITVMCAVQQPIRHDHGALILLAQTDHGHNLMFYIIYNDMTWLYFLIVWPPHCDAHIYDHDSLYIHVMYSTSSS